MASELPKLPTECTGSADGPHCFFARRLNWCTDQCTKCKVRTTCFRLGEFFQLCVKCRYDTEENPVFRCAKAGCVEACRVMRILQESRCLNGGDLSSSGKSPPMARGSPTAGSSSQVSPPKQTLQEAAELPKLPTECIGSANSPHCFFARRRYWCYSRCSICRVGTTCISECGFSWWCCVKCYYDTQVHPMFRCKAAGCVEACTVMRVLQESRRLHGGDDGTWEPDRWLRMLQETRRLYGLEKSSSGESPPMARGNPTAGSSSQMSFTSETDAAGGDGRAPGEGQRYSRTDRRGGCAQGAGETHAEPWEGQWQQGWWSQD